jgi:AraC-like DNA-binding protein
MKAQATVKDLFHSLDFKALALQRIKMRQGWNFERVSSPFSHLWFVVDGHATIKHHGRTFELQPGCSHLVPARTLHDCHGEDSLDCFQLHFLSNAATGVDLFSLSNCDWQAAETPDFKPLLERLWSICSNRGWFCDNQANHHDRPWTTTTDRRENGTSLAQCPEAQSILRELITPLLASAKQPQDLHAQVATQFLAVQEFISQHMGEPIMLADLARVAGLHPTYFSDRFQQLAGIRPLEYLMRLRMDRARYLLETSKASVKEVTFNIGLRDPAYFSRVFLKYCHVSPSAYRTTCNA